MVFPNPPRAASDHPRCGVLLQFPQQRPLQIEGSQSSPEAQLTRYIYDGKYRAANYKIQLVDPVWSTLLELKSTSDLRDFNFTKDSYEIPSMTKHEHKKLIPR